MAVIGKFKYNGTESHGKLIIMDIGSNTNLTRVDLDFGTDEEGFQKSADKLSKMEKAVKEKVPSHPVIFMPFNGDRLKAVFLRGRSFNGELLPEREMVNLENVTTIISQIQEFDPDLKPEDLEVYPTL
jgi:hypothetical protein